MYFEANDKKTNEAFIDQFQELDGVDDSLVESLRLASNRGFMLPSLIMKIIGSENLTNILQKNGYDSSCSQLKETSKERPQKFKSSPKFKIKSVTNMANKDRFIEVTAFEPSQIKGKENLLFSAESSNVYE